MSNHPEPKLTREALLGRAEDLDALADNETEDEAEYHRLRAEAADLREQAENLTEDSDD